MFKNLLFVTITSFGVCSISYAKKSEFADPRHVELFNTRNFCVLCTLNEALLSPDTLYSGAHSNANISASYMYGTVMDNLDLTFAFMYAIKGERMVIKNSTVKMANISYSDLPYFTFTGNKEGLFVNFTGTGLNYANFRDATLEYPMFTGGALVAADFTGAELKYADFANTWLKDTNFTAAQIENANFTGADIENANFTGANLLNAKITEEQLQGCNVCDAILPDGSIGTC